MLFRLSIILLIMFLPAVGFAADAGIPAFSLKTEPDGEQTYSLTLQIVALMTMITMLPAGLMMLTAFTRIVIVLSILRQAIGLMQAQVRF